MLRKRRNGTLRSKTLSGKLQSQSKWCVPASPSCRKENIFQRKKSLLGPQQVPSSAEAMGGPSEHRQPRGRSSRRAHRPASWLHTWVNQGSQFHSQPRRSVPGKPCNLSGPQFFSFWESNLMFSLQNCFIQWMMFVIVPSQQQAHLTIYHLNTGFCWSCD